MSGSDREAHIHIAETLRGEAKNVLRDIKGSRDVEWAQAGALEAQARALLATSHEAAVSRIDAEQFRKDLNTVHPSGWQLPAEAVSTGRELMVRVEAVRRRFTDLWKEGGSEFSFALAEVEAFEALAQFVSRLLDEIESKKLVRQDES